jgi:hypothetical protein
MIRFHSGLRCFKQMNDGGVMKVLVRPWILPLVVLLTGCLMAPVPRLGREVTYGAAIGPEEVRFIQPHQTTREEVIACFGEPWRHYEDLHVMVYYWEISRGWWLRCIGWGGIGKVDVEEITRLRYLFVQIDALDRVERHEFVMPRRGLPTRVLAEQWLLQHPQPLPTRMAPR